MESVLKIKLNLDLESQSILDGQSKILNWLYNHMLDKANHLKEEYKKTGKKDIAKVLYSKRGLRNFIPSLKKEYPFLKSIHSSPSKNAILRLSETIQNYQKSRKGQRKGKKTGWPRFRSFKQKFFSLLYDEPKKGFKVENKKIRLSLGSDKDGKRLYIYGVLEKTLQSFRINEICNLRITKEFDTYYCIFTVKEDEPSKKLIEKIVSLDPNHKNLIYGVSTDGKAFELSNPFFKKPLEQRIDQLKSRRDKCRKRSKKIVSKNGKCYWIPSRRWRFFDKKLKNLYRVRRDQTKTFLFTVSHWLCRNYQLISVGDYTPKGGGITKGMRRSMNNESLIGRFKTTLEWVTKKSGLYYHEWKERGSTRTCNKCNYVVEGGISPDIRIWKCHRCETYHYRDENAAINGLRTTLKDFKFPCSGHQFSLEKISDEKRWALSFDGLGIRCKPFGGG